jgi:hypothetical protein
MLTSGRIRFEVVSKVRNCMKLYTRMMEVDRSAPYCIAVHCIARWPHCGCTALHMQRTCTSYTLYSIVQLHCTVHYSYFRLIKVCKKII